VIYADKGYARTERVITPFQGARLTDGQIAFNLQMSRVRECVEWAFKVRCSLNGGGVLTVASRLCLRSWTTAGTSRSSASPWPSSILLRFCW
jgi:hypothetical protein